MTVITGLHTYALIHVHIHIHMNSVVCSRFQHARLTVHETKTN
jgi:hypothetical protein